MQKLREFIESRAFGVCSVLGERFGIASSRIRMWFIYISFLTLGSPVILYMILAFWINIKNYILNGKRNPLRNWKAFHFFFGNRVDVSIPLNSCFPQSY